MKLLLLVYNCKPSYPGLKEELVNLLFSARLEYCISLSCCHSLFWYQSFFHLLLSVTAASFTCSYLFLLLLSFASLCYCCFFYLLLFVTAACFTCSSLVLLYLSLAPFLLLLLISLAPLQYCCLFHLVLYNCCCSLSVIAAPI